MEQGRKRVMTGWKGISAAKWIRWGILFLAGLILAGGRGLSGAYPLGLAAAAAVTGLTGAAAVTGGAVLGSAAIGGILPLTTAALFAARAGISLWLAWEGRPTFRSSGNPPARKRITFPHPQAMVRYSRTSGWGKRQNADRTDPEREEKHTVHTRAQIPSRRKETPDAALPRSSRNGGIQWEAWLTWADNSLFAEQILLRMTLGTLATLCTGGWAMVNGGFLSYDLWSTVLSVLLSPLLIYLFYAASDRRMRTSAFREVGILTVLSLLCRSLSGITIPLFAFDLGQGAALAAAVLVGSSYGCAKGGMVGLACGLLLEPLYTPAYTLAGLITGAFSTRYGGSTFLLGLGSSRSLGLLAASVSALIWLGYSGGLTGLAGLVPEILLVTAAMLPFFAYDKAKLPVHWCSSLPDTKRSERTAVAEMVMAGRERKLQHLGDGMTALGEMLTGVSEKLVRPTAREMRDLAEECLDGYCERCGQRKRCVEQEFTRRQAMLTHLGTVLTEEGAVCGSDIPPELGSRCGVMGRALDEINAAAARRMDERYSGDKLRVAAEDFTHMGRLLAESAQLEEEAGMPDRELTARLERILSCHDFAAGSVAVYGARHKRIFVHDIDLTNTRMGGEEIAALFGSVVGLPLSVPEFTLDGPVLSMEMHTTAASRCEWGKCARAASALGNGGGMGETGEFSTGSVSEDAGVPVSPAPSGDTVAVFEGDGRQYMLLSDGMGTGRMAALTSGMAAVFLERMLTAGVSLETALKMLNHVIRAGCGECAATVDLCEIDLVTLEARFIKSGAAPSFVIRGGSLFRLQSKTVPIGILRALDAEMIRFTVEPGDVIVMLSDGIARSFEECPWLLDFLSTDEDVQSGSVQRAAEKIIAQAAARGAVDDITAGVLRVV